MKGSTRPQILGPVDTAFLQVERPEAPMNIGAVTIFDGQIDFDQFTQLVDSRIHKAPIYMKRLVQAPFNLGPPTWVYDPDFYIGNHIFHLQLGEPGTEEQLRVLTGQLVSSMLDREKPLWEIYVINGLEDNRTGVFFKVHHCMVDGLAAVEIFSLLMDLTPEIPDMPNKPLYDPPELPTTEQLLVDSVRLDLPHKWKVLNHIGRNFSEIGSILVNKEKRRKTFVGIANLLNDNLSLIKKLPINGRNGGTQQIAWAEFSLAEVRAIKSACRSSVNDVMLTVLGAAIGRYVREINEPNDQDFVRVLVPVTMRMESEKNQFGNRISVLPIDIPLHVTSPLERLAATTKYTNVMKDSSLTIGLDVILSLPSLAPAWSQPLVWGIAPTAFSLLAHTWCTNVAGPQIPMYVMGHQLLNSYGFFPLNPSMGLACVVTSYNQRIAMNLIADTNIVPDVTEIRDYLIESYQTLRRAAKVQPIEPIEVRRVTHTQPAPTVSGSDEGETPETTIPHGKEAESAQPSDTTVSSTSNTDSDHKKDLAALNAVSTNEPSDDEISHAAASDNAPANVVRVEKKPPIVADIESSKKAALNGVSDSASSEPVGVETVSSDEMMLFSEAWAQAYKDAINNNENYYRASVKWEAGALAFVMKANPRHGYFQDAGVLLDLHKGECREAHSMPPAQAKAKASFVIEGDYESWMKVLAGESAPLAMIMRRKLRLTKGSVAKLLPFTQSAQELVTSAQYIH